jgi:uncharacterized protein (DUF1800 family)
MFQLFFRFLGLLLIASVAGGVGGIQAASAAPLELKQKRCLNEMMAYSWRVANEQHKANRNCVKFAGRAQPQNLGVPPQVQTAQACITNDVRGLVARDRLRLLDREPRSCLATPAHTPPWLYVPNSADARADAAIASANAMLADLFGPDLDLALVSQDSDKDGARCQEEVTVRMHRVYDRMFRDAMAAKSRALRGWGRLTGHKPSSPVAGAFEMHDEIVINQLLDIRGRIQREVDRVAPRFMDRCDPALTPLASMFPGVCAGATDSVDLASCVTSLSKRHFYQAWAEFDGLPVPCDLADDGEFNMSCAETALENHVLDRTGYGTDDWATSRVAALGLPGYLLEQLDPESIDDSELEALLADPRWAALSMNFRDLRSNYPRNPPVPGDPKRGDLDNLLQESKFLRALTTRRQLAEVLQDFWFNHYNVHGTEGNLQWDTIPYDRIAIRPHVLGRFSDGLLAMTRAPAMLRYLDNRLNRIDIGINENFGREMLELHSRGVATFSEADVVEASRALTGWTDDLDAVDGFRFVSSRHDDGEKRLFGDRLILPAGSGEQGGIDLIRFLETERDTAEFISRKLLRRFVAELPDERMVTRVADVFLGVDSQGIPIPGATTGDLRAVMTSILGSPEFLLFLQNRKSKTKRPHLYLTSALRALGADPALVDLNDLRRESRDMGEEMLAAAPPIGYPDASGFWASPGTILLRLNQTERMARQKDGVSYDLGIVSGTADEEADQLIAALFTGTLSSETRGALVSLLTTLAGETLATRTEQGVAFLFSSPEFLEH